MRSGACPRMRGLYTLRNGLQSLQWPEHRDSRFAPRTLCYPRHVWPLAYQFESRKGNRRNRNHWEQHETHKAAAATLPVEHCLIERCGCIGGWQTSFNISLCNHDFPPAGSCFYCCPRKLSPHSQQGRHLFARLNIAYDLTEHNLAAAGGLNPVNRRMENHDKAVLFWHS